MKKIVSLFVLQIFSLCILAQQEVCPDNAWTHTPATAEDILTAYRSGAEASRGDAEASLRNDCYLVWHSGEYILKHKGAAEDMSALLAVLPKELPLNAALAAFVKQEKYVRLLDHYYLLQALRSGRPFEEARDGVTVDMRFPTIPALDEYDYRKLQAVFASSLSALHNIYLPKLPFLLQVNGCTSGLLDLYPLVDKLPASSVKDEVLQRYEQYIPLMRGKVAPAAVLKDAEGKKHAFADFKGKLLVIDVWATWCSSCLKKMPLFLQMAEKYRDNPEVAFVTLSIDRRSARSKWLAALEKHNMGSVLNLTTDMDATSPFEEAYLVSGAPRYIVIDKEGRFVSAVAPAPDAGLEELVADCLKPVEDTRFEDLSWEEALQKAKAENRQIFVDCYTKSCGPCLWMAKNIFPQKACGDYLNPRYICLKKDMEEGDGIEIAKKYNVMMFPTYLIVNPDGTLFCQMLFGRVKSAELLIQKIQQAVDEAL